MNNRFFVLLFALFLLIGCGQAKKSPVAVEIDNIKITVDDFEKEYANSPYSRTDSPTARKEFLDNLVMRRLILKEAEGQKLDKDPEFLKSVEFFWQQSLLKLILDKKMQELSPISKVGDQEVRDYYEARKESDFATRELADVYEEIRRYLIREKQQGAIKGWMDSLREKAKIKINYGLLNVSEK
ncbi:MAG: SurA N-terminal domain-containing protein [Candidatus Omnitrophica bacterium]|nr:SurA N-terminal domain-containing protein [Candidatus Omnitrophota bacterium]